MKLTFDPKLNKALKKKKSQGFNEARVRVDEEKIWDFFSNGKDCKIEISPQWEVSIIPLYKHKYEDAIFIKAFFKEEYSNNKEKYIEELKQEFSEVYYIDEYIPIKLYVGEEEKKYKIVAANIQDILYILHRGSDAKLIVHFDGSITITIGTADIKNATLTQIFYKRDFYSYCVNEKDYINKIKRGYKQYILEGKNGEEIQLYFYDKK